MRADHDHGNTMAAHDLFQHVQAAHSRHLQIQRNNLGFEFLDLFQAEVAVHRSADNLDGVVGLQNLRNQLSHQGGVRSEEHTSELQSHVNLVCRLLLEK